MLFVLNYSVYRYKGDHDATMTIVDVGLLTGFIFDEKDLKSVRAFTQTYSSKVIYYDYGWGKTECVLRFIRGCV